MIKTICINHTSKDFFGNDRLNCDSIDYDLTPQIVDKVCNAVASGRAHAAHFIHEDGQVDGIWKDYGDESGQVTWCHEHTEWNKDAPTKTMVREFKRKMKAALE